MSRFAGAILIPAVLSLCSAAAAQNAIPPALVGNFSADLQQCEKPDYTFTLTYFYSHRLAQASSGYVLSYKVNKNLFILSLATDNCERWTEEITVIDDQKIKIDRAGISTTLSRCPIEKNAQPAAGFGSNYALPVLRPCE